MPLPRGFLAIGLTRHPGGGGGLLRVPLPGPRIWSEVTQCSSALLSPGLSRRLPSGTWPSPMACSCPCVGLSHPRCVDLSPGGGGVPCRGSGRGNRAREERADNQLCLVSLPTTNFLRDGAGVRGGRRPEEGHTRGPIRKGFAPLSDVPFPSLEPLFPPIRPSLGAVVHATFLRIAVGANHEVCSSTARRPDPRELRGGSQ